MGLFFNIDYNIYNFFNDTESSIVSLPEAQADTASTTVEVQNAPPTITVDPAEVPASTSTSPINIGDTLTITVTATDGESNSYYLIICSSDSIIASTTDHTSHTCTDTTFGSSTLTATGDVATTTFTVADPVPSAETDAWYAFVCDSHTTQSDCSNSSQGSSPGSGDDSSPFYINHAPVLTSVSTTDDNKDPGNADGNFVVTATTTDTDVAGGLDELTLYICDSPGWSVATECDGSILCQGTSTSPNISCDFASGTPVAADGDYEYYAYVKDQHSFAATSSATSTYSINNVAPVVSNVIINGSKDIILNMKGMDEYLATTSSVSISDNNGCSDIVSATSTIYWSDVTDEYNCAGNDNNCYPIASTHCEIVSGSCASSSDASLAYICSTTLAYHAIPTDDATSSPYETSNWLAGITAFDDDGAYGTATSVSGVEVTTLIALHVSEDAIPYLTIKSGENTGTYNATTTIINYGNCPLDSGVDVDNMTGPDTIEAENQQFATSTFTYGSGTWSVEQASSTLQVDIVAAKPTSQTDVSDEIYWGISIPSGKPSGNYAGINTFTAILDIDSW